MLRCFGDSDGGVKTCSSSLLPVSRAQMPAAESRSGAAAGDQMGATRSAVECADGAPAAMSVCGARL